VYRSRNRTPQLRRAIVNLGECATKAIDAIMKAADADLVAATASSWIEHSQRFWWTRNIPWQLEMLEFTNGQPFHAVRVTEKELFFVSAEDAGTVRADEEQFLFGHPDGTERLTVREVQHLQLPGQVSRPPEPLAVLDPREGGSDDQVSVLRFHDRVDGLRRALRQVDDAAPQFGGQVVRQVHAAPERHPGTPTLSVDLDHRSPVGAPGCPDGTNEWFASGVLETPIRKR